MVNEVKMTFSTILHLKQTNPFWKASLNYQKCFGIWISKIGWELTEIEKKKTVKQLQKKMPSVWWDRFIFQGIVTG
jgi:hypothetical protein